MTVALNLDFSKSLVFKNEGVKILIKLLIAYLPDYKEGESDLFIESVLDLINKLITEIDPL